MYFGPCSTKNKETPQQKNAFDTVMGIQKHWTFTQHSRFSTFTRQEFESTSCRFSPVTARARDPKHAMARNADWGANGEASSTVIPAMWKMGLNALPELAAVVEWLPTPVQVQRNGVNSLISCTNLTISKKLQLLGTNVKFLKSWSELTSTMPPKAPWSVPLSANKTVHKLPAWALPLRQPPTVQGIVPLTKSTAPDNVHQVPKLVCAIVPVAGWSEIDNRRLRQSLSWMSIEIFLLVVVVVVLLKWGWDCTTWAFATGPWVSANSAHATSKTH
jgi:hypothetical protein